MAKAVQVVPSQDDYVFQAWEVSRSAHRTPVLARKLVFLAMAQMRPEQEGSLTVEMRVNDVQRALGFNDSGQNAINIREAARELREQTFDIDTPDGWLIFGWVDACRFIKSRDVIQIRLSEEIRGYVTRMKDFSKLWISDMAKLQGKYSMRIFELVMANDGHEGKAGNQPGTWFADLTFQDLRTMFKISRDEYAGRYGTGNFRRRVVDEPIAEINRSSMGIHITPDYDVFRKGRELLGVRLKVERVKTGDPKPVKPATQTEKENLALREKHPEKWAEFLATVRSQGELFAGESPAVREAMEEAEADQALEAYLKTTRSKRVKKTL